MTEHIPTERRRDFHRQVLIEVAIRLQRHHGTVYARQYLADVNIPEVTVERVLSSPHLRQPLSVAGTTSLRPSST